MSGVGVVSGGLDYDGLRYFTGLSCPVILIDPSCDWEYETGGNVRTANLLGVEIIQAGLKSSLFSSSAGVCVRVRFPEGEILRDSVRRLAR